MLMDATGKLYVAYANKVSAFPTGATTPSVTLSGISSARALALDSSGYLYVTDSTVSGAIYIIAPGIRCQHIN